MGVSVSLKEPVSFRSVELEFLFITLWNQVIRREDHREWKCLSKSQKKEMDAGSLQGLTGLKIREVCVFSHQCPSTGQGAGLPLMPSRCACCEVYWIK